MKTINYNDYSFSLAREFSGFLQRKWEVKTSSSRNLIYVSQVGASTKFILRYERTSDALGGYNKPTKGDSILMTFFYYKLHIEI